MTKQVINVGTSANDRKGDSLRAAFTKVNANFTELYTAIGGGSGTTDRLVNGDAEFVLLNEGSAGVLFPTADGVNMGVQGAELGVFPASGTTNNAPLVLSSFNSYVNIKANGQGPRIDWRFNEDGTLLYPNNSVQQDTGTVQCLGNATTVVYTASGQFQHTIRLLIQVEGFEGAEEVFDTQACEMIIAKSFRGDDIASSVYGIVHTSLSPLATFTAEWNALTSRVEVMCTTASANSVNVRTFATEISTSD